MSDEFKLVAKVEVNTANAVTSINNLDKKLEKLTRGRQIKGFTNLKTVVVAINSMITVSEKMYSVLKKQSTQLTAIKNSVEGVKDKTVSATNSMKSGFNSVNSTLAVTNTRLSKTRAEVSKTSTKIKNGFERATAEIKNTKSAINSLGTKSVVLNSSMQSGFNKVNSSVRSLKGSVDNTTSSIKKLKTSARTATNSIKSGAKKSTSSMNRLNSSVRSTRGSFLLIPKIIARASLSVYILEQAFRQVSKVVEMVFAPAIDVSAELETNILGVAGILASIGTIDGNPITDINEALAISSGMMDKLRGKAIASSATFQELAETFKTNLGFGLKLGFDEDQTMEATVVISNAVKTMMGAMGTQRQLVQESKSLLNPNQGIKAGTDSLASALGITTQLKKQWLEEGNYYEKLMERFAGFKKMSSEFNKTYAGSLSNLEDAFQGVLAITSKRMFTSVTDDILDLQQLFMEVKDGEIVMSEQGTAKFDTSVMETMTTFYDNLGGMVREISPIVKDSFNDFMGFIKSISTTLPTFGVGVAKVFSVTLNVLEKVVSYVLLVASKLGSGMSPTLDSLQDAFNNLYDSMVALWENDTFIEAIDLLKVGFNLLIYASTGLYDMLAIIPDVIIGVINQIKELWLGLKGIATFLTVTVIPTLAMGAIAVASFAFPFVAIPVLITAVITSIYALAKMLPNTMDKAFKSTTAKFEAFKTVVSNFFKGKYSGFGEAFNDYNSKSNKIELDYGTIWENGKEEASKVVENVKESLSKTAQEFKDKFGVKHTELTEASQKKEEKTAGGALGSRNKGDDIDEEAEAKETAKMLASVFNSLMAEYNNSYTDFNERRKKIDNEYTQSVKALASIKEAKEAEVNKLKKEGYISDLKAIDVLKEADNDYYKALAKQEDIRQERLAEINTALENQKDIVLESIDKEKEKRDENHESRMKQLNEYLEKLNSLENSNRATIKASEESEDSSVSKIDTTKALKEKLSMELKDSLKDSIKNLISGDGTIKDVLEEVGKSLGDTLATAWADELSTRLNKLLEPITSGLTDLFTNMITGLFGGTPTKKASGGAVTKKASGGFVSGRGTSTSDSIPAMLSDGEYVINAKAVSKIGVGNLDALNKNMGSIPNGNSLKFASGGLVKASQSTHNTTSSSTDNSTASVVYAPNVTVNSSSGETDIEAKVYKAMAQGKDEFLSMVKKAMVQDSGMRDAVRNVF